MSFQTSAQDSNRRQIKSLIDSGLAYRSSSSMKIIKEWKTVNNTSAFKLLSALFSTVSTRTKTYVFNLLKIVDNLYDSEDTPYDIILIRKYSKVFRIFDAKRQNIMRIAVDKIKDYIQLPVFIKNLPFMLKRLCIKDLACHYKAKLFKRNLVSKTKQRSVYTSLKARYLMTVCENFLSKKDISKDLYDGFRHWYLRTTIKTLYILDSEMTPLVRKRVGIAAKTLDIILSKAKRSAFLTLKTNQFYKWNLQKNTRRGKEINKLIEIINTVFARFLFDKQIFQIPYNGDSLKLFYYSQAFENIKSCERYKFNKKYVKGANLLADLFRYKKLSAFSNFLRFPTRKNTLARTLRYDDKPTMGADKLFWVLFKAIRMLKLSFFSRTKSLVESIKTKDSQRKCILNVLFRNKNKKEASILKAFMRWKSAIINFQRTKYATQILLTSISDIKSKFLSKAFNQIRSHVNLSSIISNQSSMIVAYQGIYAKKAAEINRLARIEKMTSIILKDNRRIQVNERKIGHYFRRWIQQVPFSNTKLKEYNQLLEIIESENNYLKEEINEMRQETPSPFGLNETNKLESKMKFLEFLEIQNSEIIEALENIDILRDAETREIELELLGRPKRSYSF